MQTMQAMQQGTLNSGTASIPLTLAPAPPSMDVDVGDHVLATMPLPGEQPTAAAQQNSASAAGGDAW